MNKNNDMARVAYITSMKKGLPSFVAREITELEKQNIDVRIYATKYSHGLYMPSSKVYKMVPILILLKQVLYFIKFVDRYVALLLLAIKSKTVIDFFIACDFASDMKKGKIDRIHCIEGLRSFNIGYYCKRLLSKPLTVTIYADGLYIAPSEFLFRKALKESDRIITICNFNKSILVNKFNVPAEKIQIIPVVLDTTKIYPQKTFNILIVAQFAVRKGHRVLFEAVKRLNRKEIRIWVVGNRGTDKTYVDVPGLVKQLNLENQVIQWGNVTEPALFYLYQACDLFCLPSIDAEVPEGTPVALMEAMAFEKPVISTDHAGIPEYVKQKIVNQNNIDELSNAIKFYMENPDKGVKQGKENREIIQEKFSIGNIIKLKNIFEGE